MSKKRIAVSIGLSVLILLTLCFIWGNSVVGKAESSAQSEEVYEVVKPIFDAVVGEDVLTVAVLRKMAHFFEFTVLGLESYLLFFTLKINTLKNYLLLLIFGFAVGGIDEIIQIFSNRGSQFVDVLLDFSGYLFSAIFFITVRLLKTKGDKPKGK